MTRHTTTGQNNWQPRARSGLTREYTYGPLHPMEGEVKGRWWLTLLVAIAVVGTLAVAAVS